MKIVEKAKSTAADVTANVKSTSTELATRGQEVSVVVRETASEFGKLVYANSTKLSQAQTAAVKGGYTSVLAQLKLFGDVRGLTSLKGVLKTQAAWLPEARTSYVGSVKSRSELVKEAGTQVSELLKGAFGKITKKAA